MSIATLDRLDVVAIGVNLPDGFSVEVVMVTPATAEEWLGKNMRNRKEKPRKQAQYMTDMVNGAWLLTGQAIQFDWNGELVDGQNRLRSVINSGKAIPALVVRGLDPEVRSVIDTGSARTSADSIDILDGYPNSTNLAALTRLVIAWEKGVTWLNNYKPTTSEMRKYINSSTEKVDMLLASVSVGKYVARRVTGSTTFWAFAHYATATAAPEDHSADDADEFFRTMADMDGLAVDDPRSVLYKRLHKDDQRRGPAAEFEKRALVFRAWNLWRDRDSVTRLQAPRSGWTHKTFPRPY